MEALIAGETGFERGIQRLIGSFRLGRALRLVWEASPRWSLLSLGLVGLQALVPLAVLYLTKLVVDAVAAGLGGGGPGFQHVLLLIGLTAIVGLLGSVAGSLSGLVSEAQGHMVTDHVLEILHRKSVAVDLAYYEDPAYHDSLHRAQQEAPHRPNRVLEGLLRVSRSGITVVGIVGLLATVHWLLAVLLFAAVIPGLVVRVRYAGRTYHWEERRAALQRRSNYLSWLLVNPGPAKEVRTFGLGSLLIERFRGIRARLRKERIGLARVRTLGDIGAQTVAAAAVFVAFGFIAFRTYTGALTLGDLVMYLGAVQRGQSLLQGMFSALGGLYEDNLFLGTLEDFLAVEPRVVAPADPAPVPRPMRRGFRFEGVSFRYPGSSRPLLDEVDLEIRPDEVVALVGPNGAGKTTIVKLLCRLYDPVDGRITLDGVDMRRMAPEELRGEMTVVFQDYVRYYLTVRENIWLGDVDRPADDEAVGRAAATAGADALIGRLPNGYDTMLGRLFPEGEELSIGEWQKIALARAFFGKAQLLIVDEPTSALDAAAEAELFETLTELVRGRSTLLISHRFSTVRMADRIYVLEDGRVVESGSHDDLLGLEGTYARLYRLQASMYAGDRGPAAAPDGMRDVASPGSLR